MIKVLIKVDEKSNKITCIEVKGHAMSNDAGIDLVCAGISAVITGGMNALNKDNFTLKLDEGYALIKARKLPSDTESIVLRTIETQIKTFETSYSDFIKIMIEKKG